MVVIYGENRSVRKFGKDSAGAEALAAELSSKGHEVWVLSTRNYEAYTRETGDFRQRW